MADGVLRHRHGHGMIADLRLDALHRARHVALDARTAGARRFVVGVLRERLAHSLVTPCAQHVGVGAQLRIAFDLRLMRLGVARGTGEAALQVTLTLPQTERIVGEPPRAPIRPIGGIAIRGLREFQDRQEIIVVVRARRIPHGVNVAEGVALRAHHGVALRIQPRLQHDVMRRAFWRRGRTVVRHMPASRAVTAFAVGAEILPGSAVLVLRAVIPLLLTAHVARETVLVPDLDQHFAGLIGIGNIEVVEPLLAQHIPTGRQDDHPPAGECGEVVLDAPVAQGVIHAVLFRLSDQRGFGDVVDAVALARGCRGRREVAACRGRNRL